MGYTMNIAGTRGTRTVCGADFLEYGGATSCYVFISGEYAMIVDCGSGLSIAKEWLKDCTKIDILLTHLHYDHIIGLLDFEVFPKNVIPDVYSTFEKWNIKSFSRAPYWPVPIRYRSLNNMEWGETRTFGDDKSGFVDVTFYESNHPDNSSIIEFQFPNKSVLVMADYEHGVPLQKELMKPFDYILYDAMYTDEDYIRCKGYGHSTQAEGIKMAQAMPGGQLLLVHHNPNYNDSMLREMELAAQEKYPNSIYAKSGQQFKL